MNGELVFNAKTSKKWQRTRCPRGKHNPELPANRSQSEFELEPNLNLIHGWHCVEALGIDAVLEIIIGTIDVLAIRI